MKNFLPIFILILLSGCAGSAFVVHSYDAEELKTASSLEICGAYSIFPYEKLESEISRRSLLPVPIWADVKFGTVAIGMSETALICARGYPFGYGSVNTTSTKSGTKKQYVYRPCETCRARYFYVENGKVTALQN